jgi:cell division initiation protein
MRITPLEVQNHQFARRLSGYDPEEVGTFLHMVADDYEKVVRENARMKDRIYQLEKRIDELASGEKILRSTLVSAQDMAEKLRETAVAESEVLLSTAESRAEKIMDASHRRAARLGEEVRELKGLRTRYATALRSTINTHLSLIDHLENEPDEQIPHLTGILRPARGPREPVSGSELKSPARAEANSTENPKTASGSARVPAPIAGP